jgi:sialic acid synthase SpsE
LVAGKPLEKGHIVTPSDLTVKRKPGHSGFHPDMYSQLIGKRIIRSVEENEPVSWDVFVEESK